MEYAILTSKTRSDILSAVEEENLVVDEGIVTSAVPGHSVGYSVGKTQMSVGMGAEDIAKLGGLEVGDKIRVYAVPQRSLVHMVEKI